MELGLQAWHGVCVYGVDEAGKNDGAGALDVVVEHGVVVAVPLQIQECMIGREVLKLDQQSR